MMFCLWTLMYLFLSGLICVCITPNMWNNSCSNPPLVWNTWLNLSKEKILLPTYMDLCFTLVLICKFESAFKNNLILISRMRKNHSTEPKLFSGSFFFQFPKISWYLGWGPLVVFPRQEPVLLSLISKWCPVAI